MIKFDDLNCKITLLSAEEYMHMRKYIPPMNEWWWLRSHGYRQNSVAYVRNGGSVNCLGIHAIYDSGAVRPALKSEVFTTDMIGEEVSALENRWTVCGEGIAISNVIIGYHCFDDKSNDYEKSEIKRWLEEWKRRFEET